MRLERGYHALLCIPFFELKFLTSWQKWYNIRSRVDVKSHYLRLLRLPAFPNRSFGQTSHVENVEIDKPFLLKMLTGTGRVHDYKHIIHTSHLYKTKEHLRRTLKKQHGQETRTSNNEKKRCLQRRCCPCMMLHSIMRENLDSFGASGSSHWHSSHPMHRCQSTVELNMNDDNGHHESSNTDTPQMMQ
jgi:hypothetical protein